MRKILYFLNLIIIIITITFTFTTNIAYGSNTYNNYNSVINDISGINTFKDVAKNSTISSMATSTKNTQSGYTILIEDDEELLKNSDYAELTSIMTSLSKYGNVYFKSTKLQTNNVSRSAHDFYYGKFGSDSGCLFLIDMGNREIYIHVDGEFRKTVTDKKCLTITDNVYRYASSREYGTCATKAFKQMNNLFEGQHIPQPMKYITSALVSMVIGFLITFINIFRKSRIKVAPAKEVLNKSIIHFNVSNFAAEKTGERKVYNPPASSYGGSSFGGHGSGGGGHSSGHSSHGSHSSGGGGGHSF